MMIIVIVMVIITIKYGWMFIYSVMTDLQHFQKKKIPKTLCSSGHQLDITQLSELMTQDLIKFVFSYK